jgi:DNA repair protein RadC
MFLHMSHAESVSLKQRQAARVEDTNGGRQRLSRAASLSAPISEQRPLHRLPPTTRKTIEASVLKDRLATVAGEDISPRDALFLFLTFVHSQEKSRVLADHLFSEFGSLSAVLGAEHPRLTAALPGLENDVTLLKCVHRMLILSLREPLEDGIRFTNHSQLNQYLISTLAQEKQEVCRLLFLNSRNGLIKDEIHSRGTVNFAPVHIREIIRRVIETDATAIVIAHNHISGEPDPSIDDIIMTREIAQALACLDTRLHDHVIVGRKRCVSLRSLGLF